jgi:two-component system sensor histidine kinase RegB
VNGKGRGNGAGGFIQGAAAHNLRQLVLLRNISIVAQILTIVSASRYLAVSLPIRALLSVSGVLALVNLATFWRLQFALPVTDLEVFGQILVDIGGLGGLLYFSGGASNPLVGLFLVPLTIAAACLPWIYVGSAALMTLACYSLLIFFHIPLSGLQENAQELRLVVFGTLADYVLCGSVIAYIVVAIATALRKRARVLAEMGTRETDPEYTARVGVLAAAVAHEIRSPLTTMSVLVKELLQPTEDLRELMQKLQIISDQIEACQCVLSDVVTSAMASGERSTPVDRFLDEVTDRWRMLRPGVKLTSGRTGSEPPPEVFVEPGLSQAILSLLNNAADASPDESVEMNCIWNLDALEILIEDRGDGIPPELAGVLGRRPFTTKHAKGAGVGLVLAKASIERAGGSLLLSNRPGGGGRAAVVLPAHAAWRADQDEKSPERPRPTRPQALRLVSAKDR